MRTPSWPTGRPRILVADAWLANAGDGAIALATQERLDRLVPGAAVLHAAYQGDLLADHYPELTLVPPLAGLVGVTPAIPEMRGVDPEAARALVDEADVVLSQGGGFTLEHYDPLERLLAWEVVVERGIPLAFGAQTIGRFRRDPARSVLRRVLPRAAAVAVREDVSAQHVLDLGTPHDRVLVTADEVFGLTPAAPPPAGPAGIAVVLSGETQLRADGSVAQARDTATLARLVERLAAHAGGEHVTLLSTCQGLGHLARGLDADEDVTAAVLSALPRPVAAQVRTLPGHLGPRVCAREIAAHRLLVSTRMHPAILAVTAGVPTALLSQAYKATATFMMLGLDEVLVRDADPVAGVERWLRGEPRSVDVTHARERAGANDEVVHRLLAEAAVRAAR